MILERTARDEGIEPFLRLVKRSDGCFSAKDFYLRVEYNLSCNFQEQSRVRSPKAVKGFWFNHFMQSAFDISV